jgi:hypothetical protein
MLNLDDLKASAFENGAIEEPMAEIVVPDLRTGTQYPTISSNNLAHTNQKPVTNLAYRSRLLEKADGGLAG